MPWPRDAAREILPCCAFRLCGDHTCDGATRRGPDRLLLQPVLALGLFRRPAAAGHRAPPPGEARRSSPTTSRPWCRTPAACRCARGPGRAARYHAARARPLAPIPRHAAGARAEALPAAVPADPDWNKYAGWMVIAAQDAGLDAFPCRMRCCARCGRRSATSRYPRCARPSRTRTATTGRSWWRRRRASACRRSTGQYSDEAEPLGVFGAPTYVLEGELFWGQDRLEFVDRALDAIRSATRPGHGRAAGAEESSACAGFLRPRPDRCVLTAGRSGRLGAEMAREADHGHHGLPGRLGRRRGRPAAPGAAGEGPRHPAADRLQGRRRRQHRLRVRGARRGPTATRCCSAPPPRTASTPRSTRSCRSTSRPTSRPIAPLSTSPTC